MGTRSLNRSWDAGARPPPNSAVLRLSHIPADRRHWAGLDVPYESAQLAVMRHIEEIARRPAIFVKQLAEVPKQRSCIENCRFPDERRHI
jgi:hypothetical protein